MSNTFSDKNGADVGPVDFNLTLGRKAAALTRSFNLSNEDSASIGALTETAPASDTASSGLNGRLQRIAQRITSLIALLPASLGTKTAAASLPVTLASDGPMVVATGTTADTAYSGTGAGTIVGLLKWIGAQLVSLVAIGNSTTPSPIIMSLPYQAVAVSQTNKLLGATGAVGDTLQGIIIQPTGTTVGSIVVSDGATAVYTYPGGTVGADLRPIVVGMGMPCVNAGWKITTPSNATVLALGRFT